MLRQFENASDRVPPVVNRIDHDEAVAVVDEKVLKSELGRDLRLCVGRSPAIEPVSVLARFRYGQKSQYPG
jgi:hypothetical protein